MRNLLTEDSDSILIDMAIIEGEGWLNLQWMKEHGNKELGFFYALNQTKMMKLRVKEDPDYYNEVWLNLTGPCIYGAGGFNRWFVRHSGEVLFSKHHICSFDKKKIIKEVEGLDFSIF